jgi:hypothetical protein
MPRGKAYAERFALHYAKELVEQRLELVPQGNGTYRLSWGREKVSKAFELPEGGDARSTIGDLRLLAREIECFLGVS